MTVTIMLLTIGDVVISAPIGVSVTVEKQHSIMNSALAPIAAPTLAAHRAETESHVPEVRCWTSQNRVRTEDATVITAQASVWVMAIPTTHAPGTRRTVYLSIICVQVSALVATVRFAMRS